jgi:hypothetical protein
MQQWYFLSHVKSQADWDTCYGRRPSMIVWSFGGKVSMNYFPTTHNTVVSPLLALLHLQGWPI